MVENSVDNLLGRKLQVNKLRRMVIPKDFGGVSLFFAGTKKKSFSRNCD